MSGSVVETSVSSKTGHAESLRLQLNVTTFLHSALAFTNSLQCWATEGFFYIIDTLKRGRQKSQVPRSANRQCIVRKGVHLVAVLILSNILNTNRSCGDEASGVTKCLEIQQTRGRQRPVSVQYVIVCSLRCTSVSVGAV